MIRDRSLWIGLRTLAPVAAGLLGGMLVIAPVMPAWFLWPTLAFGLGLGAALVLDRRPSGAPAGAGPRPWPRDQTLGLALGFLGSGGCLLFGIVNTATPLVGWLGLFGFLGGIGALFLGAVHVWRTAGSERPHYFLIIRPWVALLRFGLLGGWLVSGVPRGRLDAANQAVLGATMLLMLFDLILFTRWHAALLAEEGPARDGGGETAGPLSRANLYVWGGGILPAALLLFAMTGGGTLSAWVAWLLMLVGEAFGHDLALRLAQR